MYSFPSLELVSFSMSSSNCCLLTCKWISQETGKVVCYSHLFMSFPVCCFTNELIINMLIITTKYGTMDLFQIGKGCVKTLHCHPAYLTCQYRQRVLHMLSLCYVQLCKPINFSPPGSYAHGVLQTRIL